MNNPRPARWEISIFATLCALQCLALASCGGGESDKPDSSNIFEASGSVASTKALAATSVTMYGADGKACGTTTTDAAGEYSIQATCKGPILMVADTPELTGKEAYALTATSGARTNVNPFTMAAAELVLGARPTTGLAFNVNLATQDRISAANARIGELIQPIVTKMGLSSIDFVGGSFAPGSAPVQLLEAATVTSELVNSASKQLIRVQLASEHRPVVIARDTRQDLKTAAVDSGLGIAVDLVDQVRLQALRNVLAELRATFEGASVDRISALTDACYLHNGSRALRSLYDMPEPFNVSPGTTVSNVRLQRYNIYTDFANETQEQVNVGGAALAQVSWDFVDGRGMTQRAFTWLINGTQSVNGCASSGNGWRVLGNQRPLYVRSSTYALHKILYNSAFAGRTDTYGTGDEFYLGGPGGNAYTYALISGPGLNVNGVILYLHDGAYLRYNGTVNAIRSAAISGNFKPVYDAIEDSRAFVMTEAQVREIADGYYAPQNRYVVRLFAQPQDLYPTLTLIDTLPKRPYLPAEAKDNIFPSVAVNLDALVTALQTSSSVTVNWSLPKDIRGQALVPQVVEFNRKNCADASKWPGCSSRSTQINEYSLGQRWLFDLTQGSIDLTSSQVPPAGSKTFESHVRVHVLDSLARPLEVSVGMTYQR